MRMVTGHKNIYASYIYALHALSALCIDSQERTFLCQGQCVI